jgi:hypothetical protein
MRLLGTDGVDGSADLLDVEGLGTLLADVADFLPGVVLVLALMRGCLVSVCSMHVRLEIPPRNKNKPSPEVEEKCKTAEKSRVNVPQSGKTKAGQAPHPSSA